MRRLLLFIAAIVWLGSATASSAQNGTTSWDALAPVAEAAYRDKMEQVRALVAANASVPTEEGMDALEYTAKLVVYHQVYFTADCFERSGGEIGRMQACADVRNAEFAAGIKQLSALANLEPVGAALCMDQAWDRDAQIKYPPFSFLKHDDLRLLDMGLFFSCMREMKATRAGVLR